MYPDPWNGFETRAREDKQPQQVTQLQWEWAEQ